MPLTGQKYSNQENSMEKNIIPTHKNERERYFILLTFPCVKHVLWYSKFYNISPVGMYGAYENSERY